MATNSNLQMKQYQKEVRSMSLFAMLKIIVYKITGAVVVGAVASEEILGALDKSAKVVHTVANDNYEQQTINSKANSIRAYQLMKEEFADLNNKEISAMLDAKLKQEADSMTEDTSK